MKGCDHLCRPAVLCTKSSSKTQQCGAALQLLQCLPWYEAMHAWQRLLDSEEGSEDAALLDLVISRVRAVEAGELLSQYSDLEAPAASQEAEAFEIQRRVSHLLGHDVCISRLLMIRGLPDFAELAYSEAEKALTPDEMLSHGWKMNPKMAMCVSLTSRQPPSRQGSSKHSAAQASQGSQGTGDRQSRQQTGDTASQQAPSSSTGPEDAVHADDSSAGEAAICSLLL